jgi:NADPH:quinone reductase-like Zn-dependent oxidoreductase
MNAAILTQYGSPDVLQLQSVPTPTPKDNELLVKVHATTVGYGDLIARRFRYLSHREFNMPFMFWLLAKLSFGLRQPKIKILGAEFSGEVVAIGKNVTRFRVGDAVFGYLGQNFGAYAEYLTIAEAGLVIAKPNNISHAEVATVPYGSLTALNVLKKVAIKRGQKVLIVGASGSIGAGAVQLAKHYGAHVTGVCSTTRMAYVQALGADCVIDYTQEDFTQNGQRYDVIVDVLGRVAFDHTKQSLTPHGHYVYASFKMKQVWQMLWTSRMSQQKVICALSMETRDDLVHIGELIEQGVIKAVVDRCFPLAQTADAHRYAETQKKASVVITMV